MLEDRTGIRRNKKQKSHPSMCFALAHLWKIIGEGKIREFKSRIELLEGLYPDIQVLEFKLKLVVRK